MAAVVVVLVDEVGDEGEDVDGAPAHGKQHHHGDHVFLVPFLLEEVNVFIVTVVAVAVFLTVVVGLHAFQVDGLTVFGEQSFRGGALSVHRLSIRFHPELRIRGAPRDARVV